MLRKVIISICLTLLCSLGFPTIGVEAVQSVVFKEAQSFATSGAWDGEFFTIGATHYLAIANNDDGATYNVKSTIYEWLGEEFVEIQSIPTKGAEDWEFFTINGTQYLAVANFIDKSSVPNTEANSVIYKWNGLRFVEFQVITTQGAYDWEFFTITGRHFLAIANHSDGTASQIYEWNGSGFQQFQTIPYTKVSEWEFFSIGGNSYLAMANYKVGSGATSNYNVASKIYQWNGVNFGEIQDISTNGARDMEIFMIGSDYYLAIANEYNNTSYNVNAGVYRWNGASFDKIQNIPVIGAWDTEAFTVGNEYFLAVANRGEFANNNHNIDSKIYRWNGSIFEEYLKIPTSGGNDWETVTIDGTQYLLITNWYNGATYNLNSVLYKAVSFCDAVTGISKNECNILANLYMNTDGENWLDNSGWLDSLTPCDDWYGVTCDAGSVTQLSLGNNQLRGNIPPILSTLENLQVLDLQGNLLMGRVPTEMGNLPRLQRLLLNNTELKGALPANLITLPALEEFKYQDTYLCEPHDVLFQNWLSSIPDLKGTNSACNVYDYFVFEEYGGTWSDVNKAWLGDTLMCWAASAANLLNWSEWGEVPTLENLPPQLLQQLFDNSTEYWTDKGSLLHYVWRWFFSNTAPQNLGPDWSTLETLQEPTSQNTQQVDGGGHYSDSIFYNAYRSYWGDNSVEIVKSLLHDGYAVSFLTYQSMPENLNKPDNEGHALTVWGYRTYEDGTIVGLWVTDSDDYQNPDFEAVRGLLLNQGLWKIDPNDKSSELRFLPVTYLANRLNGTLHNPKWRIADVAEAYPYQGRLSEGLQTLEPKVRNILQMRKAGTGAGTIVSSPEGIECGETCAEAASPYFPGTEVVLTAAPDEDSQFSHWTGGTCYGVTSPSCTMAVDGEMLVTAVFDTIFSPASEMFTITIESDPGVTISPSENEYLAPLGTDVLFSIHPDEGYHILDVLVDEQSIGPVTNYTLTGVAADHHLLVKTIDDETLKQIRLAIVRKKCVELLDPDGDGIYDVEGEEIACEPGDNGTIYIGDDVVCDSECMRVVVPFTDSDQITFHFVPDGDNRLLRWEINGQEFSNSELWRIIQLLEGDISLDPVIGHCHSG